jgi:hypothetical protein
VTVLAGAAVHRSPSALDRALDPGCGAGGGTVERALLECYGVAAAALDEESSR